MHESHQVQHLITRAKQMLLKQELTQAKKVSIIVGEALGFDEMSLRLHWEEFAQGTPLEGAVLVIRFVPAKLQCLACLKLFPKKGSQLTCPKCNVIGRPTDTGKEFKIESIE
jgi:hydrogenase nickel incorporation protein HypA/HybF